MDENAGPNTLVTTVVASDKDGDGVTFGFVGGTTTSGLFRIEENTGNILLLSKVTVGITFLCLKLEILCLLYLTFQSVCLRCNTSYQWGYQS